MLTNKRLIVGSGLVQHRECSGGPASHGSIIDGVHLWFVRSSLSLQATENPRPSVMMPEKLLPQPIRGFRYRVFIAYRFLFSLVGLANIVCLAVLALLGSGPAWLSTPTAANFVLAVLIRQDSVVNGLYKIFCATPKGFPFWIRKRCARIYHLGGVHSAAGVCATLWLLGSTVRSTTLYALRQSDESLPTLLISWILSAVCCMMVASAYPAFRKHHHNVFERLHRFLGWLALAIFWTHTYLSAYDATPPDANVRATMVKSPSFWMLAAATSSVASSWMFLRRVPVMAVPLSEHAIMLHFADEKAPPLNGSFVRVSSRPLLEWHSFAIVPQPEPSGLTGERGYSLVVSDAGDWTRACIQNPPMHLWLRGLPTRGMMHITTLFERVVFITTGSGIAPMLGFIYSSDITIHLIWSAPQPETTFGPPLVDLVRQKLPDALIHDSRAQGRPDLVALGYNVAQDCRAEAVMVISNEKLTKKIVYGLETRGVVAFGAIWDS